MKTEVNKVKFWTPLRLACTVIAFGLLAAFGVSSCNSNDPSYNPASANRPSATPNRTGMTTLSQPILQAENRAASGAPIKLGDYSGKVLLVNLWATWCGPCRMETPELVKLNKEFRDRGVEMIGLSTEDPDASAESVSDFMREYNVDYQIGWATREVALGLMQGRTNIPQSFIIARDGRIIKRFIGFSPASTPVQLRQALEQALVEKS
ncbi:MAG TPA: TlpA disulfide reductase family protein [Pyrinomonadaceae bacterium]|nr:TlpA disulfide reductase family protein [Pyrinomonadaceae bacterium]